MRCNNIIKSYKKLIIIEDHDSSMVAFDRYKDIDLCNAIQSLTEELRAVTVLYYYEDMNQRVLRPFRNSKRDMLSQGLSAARELLEERLKME